MQCKNGDHCARKSTVQRPKAVEALCRQLMTLVSGDNDLVEQVIRKSKELDASADHGIEDQITRARKQLVSLNNRVHDLFEMSGEGT